MTRKTIAVALLTLAFATAAHASWYDDYDAGLIAARKGNWSAVVTKMSAAISQKPRENSKERTYGMDFRNYRPYYYRGVAYLNLGKYEQAIADFESTGGPGPENLGDLSTLMDRAKKNAAAASEPDPAPTPPPRNTPPVVTQPVPTPTPAPVVPQIDAALRQRAAAALAGAKQKLQSAQQRRATQSPQYTQAMSTYTDALTRNANARNNDDLNTVISLADNAGDLADVAQPPNAPAPIAPTPTPNPTPLVPRSVAATGQVIDEHADDVKRALEQYFAGEFEEAAQRFERLTSAMPDNGWIYAFLGASQYSIYAFEADENYRKAAINSFRKAKKLRTWRDGLPQ
ncbi:MAG TPA: tetratricopeptide repeat protein, partial [Thermoanaerobaculia bacterium]|nr:tetratricopeptide repeat protein [Thermoanaerobaculia bacterium]